MTAQNTTNINQNVRTKTASEQHTDHTRFTYRDCLRGQVPVPHGTNGSTLFRVLMVGGMVTFMTTINGVRNTGLDFFLQSHWIYPLTFCIAFLVRTFVAGPIADFIMPRTINKHLSGYAKGVAATVLNVGLMAPIMSAIVTLLLMGTNDYLTHYLATVPIAVPLAMLVNYFIVGPAAKLLFLNRITPAYGLGTLSNLRQNTAAIERLLGF